MKVMNLKDDILVLSDGEDDHPSTKDSSNDLGSTSEKSSKSGFFPKITSTRSLSNGSSSAFSGFSGRKDRLEDDLEVIREITPASYKNRHQEKTNIPYRERKLGFGWVRMKKEKGVNTPPKKATQQIVCDVSHLSDSEPDDITVHNGLVDCHVGDDKDRDGTNKDKKDKDTNITNKDKHEDKKTDDNDDFKFKRDPLLERRPYVKLTPLDQVELLDEEGRFISMSTEKKRKFAAMRPSLSARDLKKNKVDEEELTVRKKIAISKVLYTSIDNISGDDGEEGESPGKRTTRAQWNDQVKDKQETPLSKKDGRANPSDSGSENGQDSQLMEDDDDDSGDENRGAKRRRQASSIITYYDYGRLIWAKSGSSRPWPAVIVCHKDVIESKPQEDKAWVLWFGDYRITKVPLRNIKDFVKNFKNQFVKSYNKDYKLAVLQCVKESRERARLEALSNDKSYMTWAEDGLVGFKNILPEDGTLSVNIQRCLSRIRKMRMREGNSSSDSSFFPTNSSDGGDHCADERHSWKPKAKLLKLVFEKKHDIEKVCIACNRVSCEIAAPHPYFYGGTCSACKDELEDLSAFVSDGTSMYCVVCGSPGELIVCDDSDCNKVFCTGCIELLVSPKAAKDILDEDPWYCFLCKSYKLKTHGLLRPRPGWKENDKIAVDKPSGFTQLDELSEVEDDTPDISTFLPKRPLRVLSLFDGIATGMFVVEKLGLEVEAYYASEIHESAMNVASLNFGVKVQHIGDVQTVTDKQIAEICPIDLLIGGSPCNDLSCVNPNRRGLFDPAGTGILFFHYFRALKTIQVMNKGTHLFWLFENVNHMPREFKTHINIFLQREPVNIDAKYFSPQSRPRCFWGNVPDMYKPLPRHILERKYSLDDYVTKVAHRSALTNKVNCVTTNSNSLKPVFQMNDHADYPWITEIEKIFGFPPHYTDVGNINLRERQALLGRSWSVNVIEYILKPLTKYFSVKNKNENQAEESSPARNKGKDTPDTGKQVTAAKKDSRTPSRSR